MSAQNFGHDSGLGGSSSGNSSSHHLLLCCVCDDLLDDPMQLQCLHNCCRQCFDASSKSHERLACPSCGYMSSIDAAKSNRFLYSQLLAYRAGTEAKRCSVCKEHGYADQQALAWCATCGKSLCDDCLAAHDRMNRTHSTASLDDVHDWHGTSLNSVLHCRVHDKPADFLCLTCKLCECVDCWRQCNRRGHETQDLEHPSVVCQAHSVKEDIGRLEGALLSRLQSLPKRWVLKKELRLARIAHLKQLYQRKRRIMDAVDDAYDSAEIAVKDMYDDLEARASDVENAAELVGQKISHAIDYSHCVLSSNSLAFLFDQHSQLTERLQSLLAETDTFAEPLGASNFVAIDCTLPENVAETVRGWIGMPKLNAVASSSTSGVPTEPLVFGPASDSFQEPGLCWDVAVTEDGRLLLAALQRGMLEYSADGQRLSVWETPKQHDGQDDQVRTVAALGAGRAVVGVRYAQLIVVLRRDSSGGSAAWHEDRRLTVLQSPPWHLSAHGDALVVAEWGTGTTESQLVVASISSGDLLSRQTRSYKVRSVAITADVVITASSCTVELVGSSGTRVIEAYNHHGDQRMWTHVIDFSECLQGICATATGLALYVALWKEDGSSSRVAVMSVNDGSVLRCNAVSSETHGLQWPSRLSIASGGRRTMLAVLSGGGTMAVYPGSSG